MMSKVLHFFVAFATLAIWSTPSFAQPTFAKWTMSTIPRNWQRLLYLTTEDTKTDSDGKLVLAKTWASTGFVYVETAVDNDGRNPRIVKLHVLSTSGIANGEQTYDEKFVISLPELHGDGCLAMKSADEKHNLVYLQSDDVADQGGTIRLNLLKDGEPWALSKHDGDTTFQVSIENGQVIATENGQSFNTMYFVPRIDHIEFKGYLVIGIAAVGMSYNGQSIYYRNL